MMPPFVDNFRRLMGPFQRQIALMIGRGIVQMSDDTTPLRQLQITGLYKQPFSDIDNVGQYGFTAAPQDGAEVVYAAVGAQLSHIVIIGVEDRRYRLQGLTNGEVAIYDDQKQKVHLTRDGIVIDGANKVITIQNAPTVQIKCELDITGDLKVSGKVTAQGDVSTQGALSAHGNVTSQGDVKDSSGKSMATMRAFDTNHHHSSVQSGTAVSGPPVESE